MSERAEFQIFLAHANEDKPQVRELYRQLQEAGYRPSLDEADLIPGQQWRDAIPKAIKRSDLFVACLSERSIAKRGYVQREFRLALNCLAERPVGEIYLIPLKLDDCTIPDLRREEFGVALQDLQWLDYWKPGGFEKLVRAIEHQRGGASRETLQTVRSATQATATGSSQTSQSGSVATEAQLGRAERALQILQEQKAGYGLRVPVDLQLELEEKQAEVDRLRAEVSGNSASSDHPSASTRAVTSQRQLSTSERLMLSANRERLAGLQNQFESVAVRLKFASGAELELLKQELDCLYREIKCVEKCIEEVELNEQRESIYKLQVLLNPLYEKYAFQINASYYRALKSQKIKSGLRNLKDVISGLIVTAPSSSLHPYLHRFVGFLLLSQPNLPIDLIAGLREWAQDYISKAWGSLRKEIESEKRIYVEKSDYQIFLAHANEDKARVRELYQQLKAAGYRPWLDKIDLLPGQLWREEIPKAIARSDIFIACLSQNSFGIKGYVQREFRIALKVVSEAPPGETYLVPLKFDDCEIPESASRLCDEHKYLGSRRLTRAKL